MRDSLFYGVDPARVFGVYARFWADLGYPLSVLDDPDPHQNFAEFDLYEPNNGWTILSWNAGWEWDLRRQAQMAVSRELGCAGLLTFVYDGEYWGYELFRDGTILDHFVQDGEEAGTWFPGSDCRGRADLLAAPFPWVSVGDAAAYLVQQPDVLESFAEYDRLNVPARPGDEFSRFAECAIIDFWRLLGVAVESRDGYVTTISPIWRAFKIPGFDKFEFRRATKPT